MRWTILTTPNQMVWDKRIEIEIPNENCNLLVTVLFICRQLTDTTYSNADMYAIFSVVVCFPFFFCYWWIKKVRLNAFQLLLCCCCLWWKKKKVRCGCLSSCIRSFDQTNISLLTVNIISCIVLSITYPIYESHRTEKRYIYYSRYVYRNGFGSIL